MNLSFKQFLILLFVSFLLFGDLNYIIKNFNVIIKKITNTLNISTLKNRKKGT